MRQGPLDLPVFVKGSCRSCSDMKMFKVLVELKRISVGKVIGMGRGAGFTLAELMVVIAILGILSATALQCYQTIQKRARGSEASSMLRQLIDAEIMYYLENDKFFPDPGDSIMIFHDDLPSKAEIGQVKNALKVSFPVGHLLDCNISHLPGSTCMITVSSYKNSFALFKNGSPSITGTVDSTGKADIL